MVTDTRKEEIYREYYKKVYGYILSKINNATNAEDLTADVFLKVFEKIDTFDETKASVSTWIYTITKNTLIDYYRTRRTFDEVPETEEDGSSVEDEVCNSEMLELLARGLEALDEREREIVVLRYSSGKTLREIAAQMGISYAYVKILQNKAFAHLRVYLGG
ncbi:MAG: sigma-70 family RNA polymerase sigma factor [Clostridia bacterium]|nr:sigma-70 family RNA polymerase sigma factor [Clostridia bacterium]